MASGRGISTKVGVVEAEGVAPDLGPITTRHAVG